jgi:transcriptional regulator with XRE-family HTH domain
MSENLNVTNGGLGGFGGRIRESMRKRLFPNSPLVVKQLAAGVGRSENSILRWRNGETRLFADDLFAMARFFARRGDTSFLSEIFRDLLPVATPSSQLEDMLLSLVRTAFVGLNMSNLNHQSACYWCTADGMLVVAPVGHAEFIRRTLRQTDMAQEEVAYATSNLGWIALTISTDNNVVVEYDRWTIAALAAEQACEWLSERDGRIGGAKRRIHVESRWIEIPHDPPNSIISAVSDAGVVRSKLPRPWDITRLPVNGVTHPLLQHLLRVHNEAPDRLIDAAAAVGALSTSNVFFITGEDVVARHVASEYAFNKQAVVGQNVMARSDKSYAAMVRARVLQAQRSGPLYCAISGPLLGGYVKYLNLALPNGTGTVLTSTIPIGMTDE